MTRPARFAFPAPLAVRPAHQCPGVRPDRLTFSQSAQCSGLTPSSGATHHSSVQHWHWPLHYGITSVTPERLRVIHRDLDHERHSVRHETRAVPELVATDPAPPGRTAFCDTHEPRGTTPAGATAYGESIRQTALAPGLSPLRALFAAFWYFRCGHLEARGRRDAARRQRHVNDVRTCPSTYPSPAGATAELRDAA